MGYGVLKVARKYLPRYKFMFKKHVIKAIKFVIQLYEY